MSDEYSKPINQAFNKRRNRTKAEEGFIGICRGLTADNHINEEEIRYLDLWLADNADLTHEWPWNGLATMIRAALANGQVTEKDATRIKDALDDFIGGNISEHGAATGMTARPPYDHVSDIDFQGSTFCLTGTFVDGNKARGKCAKAIESCGGFVDDRVTQDLDYLVVGPVASRDWRHSSHGNKIRKAVSNQEAGCRVKIVSEEVFWRCLKAQEADAHD